MSEQCYHLKFCLFVTGKGETQYLPKLFSYISRSGICAFQVSQHVGQLRPRTSPKRAARIIGTSKQLPGKDFDKISAPARRHIQEDPCSRIILIDDLEGIDEQEAKKTFDRYRQALDAGLGSYSKRGSVHFLVNMFEAYFFADPTALSESLGVSIAQASYNGDVETILNPKAKLKQIFSNYKEAEHPGPILDRFCLAYALANPEYCRSLRTCVKWIVHQLEVYPDMNYLSLLMYEYESAFSLSTGRLYDVTADQE